MARLIIPALVALLVCGPTFAADYQKGLDAYNNDDHATALRELKPFAEQGDAPAQAMLGWIYHTPTSSPQDHKTAFKWYSLAGEQGDADGQYGMAYLYSTGQGVPQDYSASLKYNTLAAHQGHTLAQVSLGMRHKYGRGTIQDYTRAHMWWNIFASQGNGPARRWRNSIAKKMTPTQIETAQRLARECVQKNYRGC